MPSLKRAMKNDTSLDRAVRGRPINSRDEAGASWGEARARPYDSLLDRPRPPSSRKTVLEKRQTAGREIVPNWRRHVGTLGKKKVGRWLKDSLSAGGGVDVCGRRKRYQRGGETPESSLSCKKTMDENGDG